MKNLRQGPSILAFERTLPDSEHTPSHILQYTHISGIPGSVFLQFLLPEFVSRFGLFEKVAIVAMPEVSIDLNNSAVF
jgi:hypothetical protein|tara:strand:- start:788 stop:1021 length:234 start_codon:yes stop_codon:yes gene_type:complete